MKGFTAKMAFMLLAALTLASLSGCGGDSPGGGVDTKANRFSGSAVSNFGGPDMDDTDARADARALMVNRTYDFTETGFIIQAGMASTEAGGNVNFGAGTGLVQVNGANGTIALGVAPSDPDYSNVDLFGTFSVANAQSAVDNAGNTFTVRWEMSYSYAGTDYEIHFDQVLTGSDFRQI